MWPNERETIERSAAQEATIRELRAELQHVCDRLLRMRTELATSHGHIGALLSEGCDDATRDTARAWLRRTEPDHV